MAEFGRFGILADGRPIRLGGRVVDALTALIAASRAVVSKDARLRLVASESGCVKVRAGASTNARPSADIEPRLAIRR